MQNWMLNEAIGNVGLNFLDKENYEKAIEHYSAEIDSIKWTPCPGQNNE